MFLPPWSKLLERLLEPVAVGHHLGLSDQSAFSEVLLSTTQADILGSIVRTQNPGRETFPKVLHEHLYADAATRTSTFLRALGTLLVIRASQQLETIVITTNYDDLIESALKDDPILRPARRTVGFSVRSIYNDSKLHPSGNVLPVYHIHGFLPRSSPIPRSQQIVLSTADFGSDWNTHWSHRLFAEHWSSQWFFVGMSFTDSHISFYLTQRLRNRARSAPRPIGIFSRQGRPWKEVTVATQDALADVEIARLRELELDALATKYFFQDAQFLEEVSLRMTYGADRVQPYVDRRELWTRRFSREVLDHEERFVSLTMDAHGLLAAIRAELETLCAARDGEMGSETLKVELWCRWDDGKKLLELASSEYILTDLARAPWFELGSSPPSVAAVEAFTQGRPYMTPMDYEVPRSRWRCYFSVPLILASEPWFHLPVGTLVIASNRRRASSILQQGRPDIDSRAPKWTRDCCKLITPPELLLHPPSA